MTDPDDMSFVISKDVKSLHISRIAYEVGGRVLAFTNRLSQITVVMNVDWGVATEVLRSPDPNAYIMQSIIPNHVHKPVGDLSDSERLDCADAIRSASKHS